MVILCATPNCTNKVYGVPHPSKRPQGPFYCKGCREAKRG